MFKNWIFKHNETERSEQLEDLMSYTSVQGKTDAFPVDLDLTDENLMTNNAIWYDWGDYKSRKALHLSNEKLSYINAYSNKYPVTFIYQKIM